MVGQITTIHDYLNSREYARGKTETKNKEAQEPATEKTLKILRSRMKYEIELYAFIRRRFLQVSKEKVEFIVSPSELSFQDT